jgi:N-acetylglucosaminyl-diphospho-decaprenol L-rhamnosyltransferase
MTPSLDIVIVNWNSGGYLARCLQSIPSACQDGFRLPQVVVVDNASTDGSAKGLEFPMLPLLVISNVSNRGFAAACNQGARGSLAEYLLFLNPDMRLLENSLQTPIQFMEEPDNARIGICGIRLLDDEGRLTRSCARFPAPALFFSWMMGLHRLFPKRFDGPLLTESDLSENRQVDQVMGAFFLIRRAVFESLGGFDERFFVYFEELDLSYRACQNQWISFYLATAQAQHTGCGCSNNVKPARLAYWLRSRILYCNKHFGEMAGAALLMGTFLIEPASRLGLALSHWSFQEMRDTLQGYRMLSSDVPVPVSEPRRVPERRCLTGVREHSNLR